MALRRVIVTWNDGRSADVAEPFVEGERGSFPVGHPDPEQWCRACVDRFNATLRRGETARHVRTVVVEDLDAKGAAAVAIAHQWQKTNLVTVMDGGGIAYDTARCGVCGITGKRFGVGDVRRDKKFKPAGYATCNGAQKLLARRAARDAR